MGRKLHWGTREEGELLYTTTCGKRFMPPSSIAEEPDLADCERCKTRLAEQYVERVFEEAAETARARVAREFGSPRPVPEYKPRQRQKPPLIDPITDLPFLRPDTWELYRDEHNCKSCLYCTWFKAIDVDHHTAAWKRTHKTHRFARFSDINEALLTYANLKIDGFSERHSMSFANRLGDATKCKCSECEAAGKQIDHSNAQEQRLGANAVTGKGHGGTPRAVMQAEDKVEIERALAQCFLDPKEQAHRGLSREQRFEILWLHVRYGAKAHEIADEIGHGLTGPMIPGIVNEGKADLFEVLGNQKGMVEQL